MTLTEKYTSLLNAALDANADAAVECIVGVSRLDLEVARKVRDVAEASLNAFVLELIERLEPK